MPKDYHNSDFASAFNFLSKTTGNSSYAQDGLTPSGRQTSFDAPHSFESYICFLAGAPSSAIAEAEAICAGTDVRLHEELISRGWLNASQYCETLAQACDLAMADGDDLALAPGAACQQPWRMLRSSRAVPLAAEWRKAVLCSESASAQSLKSVSDALGSARAKIALVSRRALIQSLSKAQGSRLTRKAVYGLAIERRDESAQTGVWLWQSLAILAFAGASIGAAIILPRETLTVLCALFSIVFFLGVALRACAAAHAFITLEQPEAPPSIPDRDLPRYTVMAPLFRETRVLPGLIDALTRLDYPAAKLDIKLVLESADREMIVAVARMPLPGNVDVIIVPASEPQTKPKALNYALQFATGDYLVIFDAEDQPDADQLRKAANAFTGLPPEIVCLQARLAYHNHSENWLSRQFAIEYASLFGGVLPMLDAFNLPLPLGGTSNHFRIDALRRVGAWDAFNVTEDADLGMRIYRAGLRCKTLDSNTWEEAACQPMNWLKQRSRWLKGWMQTYSVHMRRPLRARRELGWAGFIAFQGHFASVILSALAHPLFYLLLIADVVNGHVLRAPESLLGEHFMLLAAFNFAAGYLCTLGLGLVTLKTRGLTKLIPHLLLAPFYWLLISVAAYRALYQLIAAPFHWDKTDHGVSGMITTPAIK